MKAANPQRLVNAAGKSQIEAMHNADHGFPGEQLDNDADDGQYAVTEQDNIVAAQDKQRPDSSVRQKQRKQFFAIPVRYQACFATHAECLCD